MRTIIFVLTVEKILVEQETKSLQAHGCALDGRPDQNGLGSGNVHRRILVSAGRCQRSRFFGITDVHRKFGLSTQSYCNIISCKHCKQSILIDYSRGPLCCIRFFTLTVKYEMQTLILHFSNRPFSTTCMFIIYFKLKYIYISVYCVCK